MAQKVDWSDDEELNALRALGKRVYDRELIREKKVLFPLWCELSFAFLDSSLGL